MTISIEITSGCIKITVPCHSAELDRHVIMIFYENQKEITFSNGRK